MTYNQVKGDKAICSSVGNLEKHENFKKLTKQHRIEKLEAVFKEHGVKSSAFFCQVKPLIMWTIYRNLRGMPTEYLEDLVNNGYEELIIACEGGNTAHYNKPVYKEPIYGTEKYYQKYANFGDFVMAVIGSSVAKYRSKHFRRIVAHEDSSQDISEKIEFKDFEERYSLEYELDEPEYINYFKHFKFNDAFIKHLSILKKTKPKNNILYNFILWKENAVG